MPALPRESQPARPDAVTEYRTSLAVLPFRTLQGDQADAYFAEGMVDDIIRALGGLKHLLVIARSSSHLFAGSPLDLRRIAHELDVRYVVHGSVRRAGGALRIAVELAEAPGGQVIWTDRFDGKLDDLFDFQDRIAIRVATAVAPHLRERELARATRKHPENMTAYDLTLQALDQMHRIERKALDRANALLQQAIASDPQYAFAYAQLAFLNLTRAAQGWAPRDEAIRAAVDSARAAMKYDPNDAHSLTMFGHVQSYAFRDYQSGNEFLESAIASNPSWPWAWGQSSVTCGYLGDYERSVARAEHAVRLSPIGSDAPWFEHCLSQAYYLANRFEEAAGWGRLSAIRNTSNSSNLRCLIASLVAQGEMDEAKHFAAQLIDLSPDYTVSTFRARTPLSGAVADRFAERLRRAGLPA
jgi:TolB-like protein